MALGCWSGGPSMCNHVQSDHTREPEWRMSVNSCRHASCNEYWLIPLCLLLLTYYTAEIYNDPWSVNDPVQWTLISWIYRSNIFFATNVCRQVEFEFVTKMSAATYDSKWVSGSQVLIHVTHIFVDPFDSWLTGPLSALLHCIFSQTNLHTRNRGNTWWWWWW